MIIDGVLTLPGDLKITLRAKVKETVQSEHENCEEEADDEEDGDDK